MEPVDHLPGHETVGVEPGVDQAPEFRRAVLHNGQRPVRPLRADVEDLQPRRFMSSVAFSVGMAVTRLLTSVAPWRSLSAMVPT